MVLICWVGLVLFGCFVFCWVGFCLVCLVVGLVSGLGCLLLVVLFYFVVLVYFVACFVCFGF